MDTPNPSDGVTVPLLFDGQPLWVALIIHT
jgi:hypothetical protein